MANPSIEHTIPSGSAHNIHVKTDPYAFLHLDERSIIPRDNYGSSNCAITMALPTTNKVGFIDESLHLSTNIESFLIGNDVMLLSETGSSTRCPPRCVSVFY